MSNTSKEDERSSGTDYFLERGYRKLTLRLLTQTVADLMMSPSSPENIAIIKEANDWIRFEPETSIEAGAQRKQAHAIGLTFSDCFYALGFASDVEPIRQAVLRDPKQAYKALTQAMDQMNGEEGVFVDLRDRKQEMKTADFSTSFLFDAARG